MTTTDPEKTSVNKNLVSLKLLIFLFYGALLCLWPYLPLHMTHLKFNMEEIRNITIYSALFSILGPLVFGLVLDRIAVKNSAAYGKYVKIFLFLSLTLAGIFYTLMLVVVAPVERTILDLQPVTFGCDSHGGIIYQKKCEHQTECLNLENTRGKIQLTSCSYTCQKPINFENLYESSVLKLTNPVKASPSDAYKKASSESDYDDNYDINLVSGENNNDDSGEEIDNEDQIKRRKRNTKISRVYVEPPHICLGDDNKAAKITDRYTCHAYSIDNKMINLTVESSGLNNDVNDTAGFCQHKLENFKCNIPEPQKLWMRFYMNSSHCKPMIECEIHDPYKNSESFLTDTRCFKIIGNDSEVFLLYLIIRSLADLFMIAAHSLINVAIVVATRETSVGRGNIGHQLAWGFVGTLVFAIIIGLTNIFVDLDQYLIPMVVGPSLIFVAAIVILFANNFQKILSPSEWWWHTKYGIVAIPMSAIRKYQLLTVFIALISLVFGIFWNVLEVYRENNTIAINIGSIGADNLESKTLCYAIGALLAIPILWNAENIVEKFGHSNIFIISLATYIIRFSGVISLENPSVLLLELLEPINLALTWITLIFYLRHVVTKKFLATSQAVLVLLWLGLGRAFGWWIMHYEKEHLFCILSSLACCFAVLYFIIYHCILLPFYRIPSQALNDKSFAHERVFHDERSRKGFFKY